MYYEGRSSQAPSVGSFEAGVTLEADFGNMGDTSDLGRLSGTVNNIRYGDVAAGFPEQLTLQEADIGTFESGRRVQNVGTGEVFKALGMFAVGVVSHGQPTPSWSGAWQAMFFGNGMTFSDLPTGVAGTFGATNDQDGMVGAFGARR